MIEEVKGLLKSLDESKVSWVHREANIVAHNLAKKVAGTSCGRHIFIPLRIVLLTFELRRVRGF